MIGLFKRGGLLADVDRGSACWFSWQRRGRGLESGVGQRQFEFCAAVFWVTCDQGCIMIARNHGAQGQTQTGATGTGGEIGVKNSAQGVFCNARAIVSDTHFKTRVGDFGGHR